MLLNVLLQQNSSPILDTSKNNRVIIVVSFSYQAFLPGVKKHYSQYFKQRKQGFVLLSFGASQIVICTYYAVYSNSVCTLTLLILKQLKKHFPNEFQTKSCIECSVENITRKIYQNISNFGFIYHRYNFLCHMLFFCYDKVNTLGNPRGFSSQNC